MAHGRQADEIQIAGASENNLKHISLTIPKERLVVGNIPLLSFLNQDRFHTLMYPPLGQIILAVCAVTFFVSTAFVIQLTQPIEYRR